MDSDNKFWLCMWSLLATVLICMIISCTVNALDRRVKWAEAVSNGADPMVASCALYDGSSAEHVICGLLAQNRK